MESATQIFEALAADFQWTLFTNRETERTSRWREGGARVVLFKFDEAAGSVERRVRLGIASAKALAITLRSYPTVLHGNDIRSVQLLAPAASLLKRPVAFTLRDTKPTGESYGANWQRMARRLDTMVTLSEDMRRLVWDRLEIQRDRVVSINSIVDLAAFCPVDQEERSLLRHRLGIGTDEFAVGIIAGVFDKKRQLDVISQVIPSLVRTNARLHLVGDFSPEADSYSRACAQAVEKAGVSDRVVFHGFRKDVADWLRALDVVIVASQREGLARCMIEAMACGTPVVSFDISSAREMLESTGAGVVVGADDWPGLSQAVRELIDNPERRVEMGRAGRAAAETRFDARQVAQQWRDLYQMLALGS